MFVFDHEAKGQPPLHDHSALGASSFFFYVCVKQFILTESGVWSSSIAEHTSNLSLGVFLQYNKR